METDDEYQRLLDEGWPPDTARRMAEREAYRVPSPESTPPMGMTRISPSDSPMLNARPPTPKAGSALNASRPISTEVCRCNGAGFYVADARYGQPDFGRLIPCVCTQQARDARSHLTRGQLLDALSAELGQLRSCQFTTFDLDRKLKPLTVEGTTYTIRAQQAALQAALGAAQRYADEPSGWLYIHGTVGAGKSHLAAAIANTLAGRGVRATYASTPAHLSFIKSGFRDGSADDRLLALQQVDLLVLDDLGTEQDSPWNRQALYQILNTRYLHERPTVLTSNGPIEALEPRIADRIRGMASEIYLPISSYRRIAA